MNLATKKEKKRNIHKWTKTMRCCLGKDACYEVSGPGVKQWVQWEIAKLAIPGGAGHSQPTDSSEAGKKKKT